MFDAYNKLPICHNLEDGKVRSKDVLVDNQLKFSALFLQPEIQAGLSKCGYIYLSPIQQNTLPLALTGSSIIAHAKSGTGKTLIYVLTALNDFIKRQSNDLHCLVLAPTREIATQIYDVFRKVSHFVKSLQIEFFIGGTPVDLDIIKCRTCNIAIGAPGRIKHLIDLGALKTDQLRILVLDEVDALFDHKEYAITDIISILPSSMQLIVCTATFSLQIGELVKTAAPDIKYLSTEKVEIEDIRSTSNMLIGVKQYVAPVQKDTMSMGAMKKRDQLVQILRQFHFEQCFIFVNYISSVKSICNLLTSHNFAASWLSSEQTQSARLNTLNKLRTNDYKILVTTDLAARGIDVHNANLVINVGLPCPADVYIHRMGRAGRYGSEGAVVTILCEGEELESFKKMMSVISNDPVNLHLLPASVNVNFSDLKIIECLPCEGSFSEDEFTFKRSIKDNCEKATVKKNKNCKKKKKRPLKNSAKSVLQNGVGRRSGELNDSSPDCAFNSRRREVASLRGTMENNVEPVSSAKINSELEQFRTSLSDFLVIDEPKVEQCSINRLFGSKNDGNVGSENNVFISEPPQSLLTYALYVKQRNKLLDEQSIPCSSEEFLTSLNHDKASFDPDTLGLCSVIKDVTARIGKSVKQSQSTFSSTYSSTSSLRTESDNGKHTSESLEMDFSNQFKSIANREENSIVARPSLPKQVKLSELLFDALIDDGVEASGACVDKGRFNPHSLRQTMKTEKEDSCERYSRNTPNEMRNSDSPKPTASSSSLSQKFFNAWGDTETAKNSRTMIDETVNAVIEESNEKTPTVISPKNVPTIVTPVDRVSRAQKQSKVNEANCTINGKLSVKAEEKSASVASKSRRRNFDQSNCLSELTDDLGQDDELGSGDLINLWFEDHETQCSRQNVSVSSLKSILKNRSLLDQLESAKTDDDDRSKSRSENSKISPKQPSSPRPSTANNIANEGSIRNPRHEKTVVNSSKSYSKSLNLVDDVIDTLKQGKNEEYFHLAATKNSSRRGNSFFDNLLKATNQIPNKNSSPDLKKTSEPSSSISKSLSLSEQLSNTLNHYSDDKNIRGTRSEKTEARGGRTSPNHTSGNFQNVVKDLASERRRFYEKVNEKQLELVTCGSRSNSPSSFTKIVDAEKNAVSATNVDRSETPTQPLPSKIDPVKSNAERSSKNASTSVVRNLSHHSREFIDENNPRSEELNEEIEELLKPTTNAPESSTQISEFSGDNRCEKVDADDGSHELPVSTPSEDLTPPGPRTVVSKSSSSPRNFESSTSTASNVVSTASCAQESTNEAEIRAKSCFPVNRTTNAPSLPERKQFPNSGVSACLKSAGTNFEDRLDTLAAKNRTPDEAAATSAPADGAGSENAAACTNCVGGSSSNGDSDSRVAETEPATDGLASVPLRPQLPVTLPALRSYVSAQQEQNIWTHHFAFIRRRASSQRFQL